MSKRLQYQRIALFRSDVAYQNDINISDGDAILPLFNNYHGYMHDRMFYGLRNFSERWALGRFDYIDQYMKTDFGMHADFTLRATCFIACVTGRSQYNIETFVFIEFA